MRDVLRCFLWVWVFVDCDLEGRDGVIVVGGGNGWGGRVSECMHHLSHPSRRTYLRAGLLVDRHQDVPVIMWCVGGKREGWVFMIVIRGGGGWEYGCLRRPFTHRIHTIHPPTHPPTHKHSNTQPTNPPPIIHSPCPSTCINPPFPPSPQHEGEEDPHDDKDAHGHGAEEKQAGAVALRARPAPHQEAALRGLEGEGSWRRGVRERGGGGLGGVKRCEYRGGRGVSVGWLVVFAVCVGLGGKRRGGRQAGTHACTYIHMHVYTHTYIHKSTESLLLPINSRRSSQRPWRRCRAGGRSTAPRRGG